MLAIWGARHRFEAEFRNHVTSAWLAGMLSQCPPAQYPKIESLLGGETDQSDRAEKIAPQESASNARAWGAWLRAGRRRAAKKGG